MSKPIGTYTESGSVTQYSSFEYTWGPYYYGPYVLTSNKTASRSRYNSGPGWRDLQKQGLLPPRPYSYDRLNVIEITRPISLEIIYEDFSGTQYYKAYGIGTVQPGYSRVEEFDAKLGGAVSLTELDNVVKSRFHKKAANTTFDSLVFAGEFKESVSTVRGLTLGLARKTIKYHDKLLPLVTKGHFGRKLNSVREGVQNSWLTFAYGVKPMLGDIENGIDSYLQYGTADVRKSVSTGSLYVRSYNAVENCSYPYAGAVGLRNVKLRRQVEYRCGARAVCNFPDSLSTQASRLGISWGNVVPALWELMPYSFLIDYFVNVGDVIQAYANPLPSLDMGWGVIVIEDTYEHEDVFNSTNPRIKYVGTGQKAKVRHFRMRRLVNPSTMPTIEVHAFNDQKWTSNGLRGFNLAALGSQFAGRATKAAGILRKLFR